jgi:hypothetical protein
MGQETISVEKGVSVMKRKIAAIVLTCLLLVSLAGCGEKKLPPVDFDEMIAFYEENGYRVSRVDIASTQVLRKELGGGVTFALIAQDDEAQGTLISLESKKEAKALLKPVTVRGTVALLNLGNYTEINRLFLKLNNPDAITCEEAALFYESKGYSVLVVTDQMDKRQSLGGILWNSYPGAASLVEIKNAEGKLVGHLAVFPSEEAYLFAVTRSPIGGEPKRGLIVLNSGDKEVKRLFLEEMK